MKYKIGVFGSGHSSQPIRAVTAAAEAVGEALGKHATQIIVVTGGCSGLPYTAAQKAAALGAAVWGFSPVTDIQAQKEFTPNDDLNIYQKLEFISPDLPFANNQRICMKYRNVLSTSACDAGIIVSGQWGSLNEFTNLVDMQKIVGVLTGTGGISDELPALAKKIVKPGQGEIIFNDDPDRLVEAILDRLKSKT
jgi:predicted Rossmann-fold nucleotide-binding protein